MGVGGWEAGYRQGLILHVSGSQPPAHMEISCSAYEDTAGWVPPTLSFWSGRQVRDRA